MEKSDTCREGNTEDMNVSRSDGICGSSDPLKDSMGKLGAAELTPGVESQLPGPGNNYRCCQKAVGRFRKEVVSSLFLMELKQPDQAAWLGSFSSICLEFVLTRMVHDLANAVSGVASLSRYHLCTGVSDSELEENLKLIYESAENARELLVQVGNLLHPSEMEEKLIQVSDLLTGTSKLLSALLPRSIRFEPQILADKTVVISVLRNEFMRRILALTAVNFGNSRVPLGTIELHCKADDSQVSISYRSTVKPLLPLGSGIIDLFQNIGRDVVISEDTKDGCSILTMAFPRVTA